MVGEWAKYGVSEKCVRDACAVMRIGGILVRYWANHDEFVMCAISKIGRLFGAPPRLGVPHPFPYRDKGRRNASSCREMSWPTQTKKLRKSSSPPVASEKVEGTSKSKPLKIASGSLFSEHEEEHLKGLRGPNRVRDVGR